jgi:Transglycosylase SLT domain
MNKRKLLIVLATAGVALAALGPGTKTASAEQRTLLVTLLGGQQLTVTVDVPPGTPVDQIKIPGVSTPIVSVQDITPQQQTPPTPPVQQPTQTTQPPPSSDQPATPPTSTDDSSKHDSPSTPTQEPKAAKQVKQETTGTAQKPQAPVEPEKKAKDDTKKDDTKSDEPKDNGVGRKPDGTPTPANPTFSEALPGPAPIGVPNFFIDKFRIPLFLLPIYQAAGIEYGVRWEVLAAINEIETDYGRNLNVSTAGAVGWMQFLPSTWKRWGVDANNDHIKDPYNPVDAIFSAAR